MRGAEVACPAPDLSPEGGERVGAGVWWPGGKQGGRQEGRFVLRARDAGLLKG
jgi:hypothetical protein